MSNYKTSITHLTEPIDVYSEWIDECEKEQKKLDNDNIDEDELEDIIDDSKLKKKKKEFKEEVKHELDDD